MRCFLFLFCLALLFSCNQQKTIESKSGKISAGGLRVYYEQTGEGEPILFLHAGLQNHDMWKDQVAHLSREFKVITIDLPFHGNTTGTDTSVLAKDVIRTVLDSLNILKVSVAGLSMGAAVAQDFVIGYPQRVNKAIFMAAGINGYERKFPVDSVSLAWYPKLTAALAAGDTAGAATLFAKTWGDGTAQKAEGLVKEASKYVYRTTLNTLRQHKLKGWPNLQDEPTAFDQITSLKMPVLVIHGDQDLPLIFKTSEYMEKHIPGAKRVLLKGAAHMLNMEQPDEINRLIADFLKEDRQD